MFFSCVDLDAFSLNAAAVTEQQDPLPQRAQRVRRA